MNILITGNGFDIAQGLPTAYQDFIKVLNILSATNEDELCDVYNYYFEVNSNFEELSDQKIFDLEKILILKGKLNNVWFRYFSDQLEIDTWIDFEIKLQNTLLLMDVFVKFFKEKIFYQDQHHSLIFDIGQHFGNNSIRIQLLETFKLINLPAEYNGETFVLNATYCKFNRKSESYCEFNEDEFFKFIINEWNKFIHLFSDYLEIFVNPLIEKIKVVPKFTVNRHYTFNYTNTYSKIIDSRSVNQHLHGKISENNSIVLGFNHEGYKNLSKNTIPFTKGFQRISKDADYNFIRAIPGNFSNTITVFFLGHSLDISDKKFIDEVFDLIQDKIKGRNGVMKIFFHSSKEKLLNNLCYMYGIDLIEDLVSLGKITFLKSSSDNFKKEFKYVTPKNNIRLVQNL